MKKFVAILLALSMLFALAACGSKDAPAATSAPAANAEASEAPAAPAADDKIVVGYSMKTLQEERWQKELAGCEAAAAELGVEFVYQVANGDAQTQISQIENMVTQGIDVLMVTCVDMGALTNVLEMAHEEGVKVIIYDNPLSNAYGDAFVGYEDFTNGTLIASILADKGVTGKVALLHGDMTSGIDLIVEGEKSVLKDLDVEIVYEQYCQNWAAENGLANAQNCLAEFNNDIAAFVCMNDGIASGAIQALEEVGLAGKVVVTGMDCELTAVQRIAAGTQTSTLYKNSAALSRAAIETAVKLAKGEEIVTEKTVNFSVNDMPHVIVNSAVITADNIQEVLIDAGAYTHEEVYG